MQSILRSLIAVAVIMLPYPAQPIFAQTEMTPLPAASEPLPFVPGFASPKDAQNSFLRRELQMAMLTALAMEEEAVRARIAGLPSCPEEPYAQELLRLEALLKELAGAKKDIAAMPPAGFVPPQRRTIRMRSAPSISVGSMLNPAGRAASDMVFIVAGIAPSMQQLADAPIAADLTLYLLLPQRARGPDMHAWYVYVMLTPPPGPGFSAPDQVGNPEIHP